MATDADMTCVGVRQHGTDAIGMSIDTARRSDCQTVNKLGCLAAREGPLSARDGPSVGPNGPLSGRNEPTVGPEGLLAGRVGPVVVQDGRSVKPGGPLMGQDGWLAGRDGQSAVPEDWQDRVTAGWSHKDVRWRVDPSNWWAQKTIMRKMA